MPLKIGVNVSKSKEDGLQKEWSGHGGGWGVWKNITFTFELFFTFWTISIICCIIKHTTFRKPPLLPSSGANLSGGPLR